MSKMGPIAAATRHWAGCRRSGARWRCVGCVISRTDPPGKGACKHAPYRSAPPPSPGIKARMRRRVCHWSEEPPHTRARLGGTALCLRKRMVGCVISRTNPPRQMCVRAISLRRAYDVLRNTKISSHRRQHFLHLHGSLRASGQCRYQAFNSRHHLVWSDKMASGDPMPNLKCRRFRLLDFRSMHGKPKPDIGIPAFYKA